VERSPQGFQENRHESTEKLEKTGFEVTEKEVDTAA
jgi:hypothetical protein